MNAAVRTSKPMQQCLKVLFAAVAWLCSGLPVVAADPAEVPDTELPALDVKRGEQFARHSCQLCHLFPEPALLDKKTWRDVILPKMAMISGVQPIDVEKTEEGPLLKASGFFPTVPMITRGAWRQIENYYLKTAPDERIPQDAKDEIAIGLKHFVLETPRFRREPPLTTLLRIDSARQRIYTADASPQGLDQLDKDGRLVETTDVGNIAVDMCKTDRGIYLACIGHFFPREERRGQIVFLETQPDGTFKRKVLYSELPRPSHIDVADLNNDGKPDLIVSMFGFYTGRLSWFEATGDDAYREHVLFNKAGTTQTQVLDVDGDGALDVAALIGQETEALQVYYGDKKGGFKMREIFKRPPSYGHTQFECVDFDKDGRLDFVVANGDNGDYEPVLKKYHGIRLYLNKGAQRWEEACFYPMNGAFGFVTRDFDEDGDYDIAAISFFPDYKDAPRESFVYLENLGGLRFKASTFRECIVGRWLTIDAGDVDGDGDLDIALGSLIGMPTQVPPFVKQMWEKSGPSVIVLKNILRSPATPPSGSQ